MAELGNDISNKIYEAKVSSLVLVVAKNYFLCDFTVFFQSMVYMSLNFKYIFYVFM